MRLTGLLILLTLLVYPATKLAAQSYVMIKGTVWDLQGEELVGAHALNVTKKYGTFTDVKGNFFLVLAEKDSLKVSMIGYKPYYMSVPSGLTAQSYTLNITLVSDTLMLNTATIRPYPATYREFRQEFLTLNLPEEDALKRLQLPTDPIRSKYTTPEGYLALPGPFTLLYNAFSKEAKELKKMQAINTKIELRKKLLSIIAREVLEHRFDMKTDDDIDDFIIYCGLSKEYLASTPHYIIARRVSACGYSWKDRGK
ncbi:MAG: carboxypeptidase-like regulatory domain-containing protein [Lentimicrobium sp.]